MTNLLQLIGPPGNSGRGVPIPAPVGELLQNLTIDAVSDWPEGGADAKKGTVTGGVNWTFGFFAVTLPDGPQVDFLLRPLGPAGGPNGFQIDLLVGSAASANKVAGLVNPGDFLHGADYHSKPPPPANSADPKTEWLQALDPPVQVVPNANLAVRIRGTVTEAAAVTLKILPSDGIINIKTIPEFVVFGDTGFGLDLQDGLWFDDSPVEAPPKALVGGLPVVTASDTPGWQGIALREARMFIPRGVPLISGTAVPVHFELGRPGGLDARTEVKLPAAGRRPALDVRLEWHDPAATGLSDLLPTLIEVTALFQTQGRVVGGATLGGGAALKVRARFTRDLSANPTAMAFDLAVEGAGDDGLVRVDGTGAAGKVFVTAAALATALVADSQSEQAPPSGDKNGVWVTALLSAAIVASAFLNEKGKVVVHGVSLQGRTSETNTGLRFSVDYSVDVVVQEFVVGGALSISMDAAQPMRIRYRNVSVEADLNRSGLDGLNVSFDKASMEIEDPGGWKLKSPFSLLDIVGTRSGHGSLWYEVDLKFKLDLGPLKVTNATIRVTSDGKGGLKPELRGLGVSVESGAFSGRGAATMTDNGFWAVLAAQLGAPLGVGARATVVYAGESTVAVDLDASLPGPIPLGPTMLGLYTVGGMFGLNARPVLPPPPPDDIVQRQLTWTTKDIGADPGSMMFGLNAGLGTLYDWGFSFSAYGKVIMTVPDPAIRIALKAWFLTPPGIDKVDSPFTGLMVIDGGVIVGLRGNLTIDHLLEVQVPVNGQFSFAEPTNWYLHIGSDGPPRPPGPIQAHLLPDLFDIGGFAYLMLRGAGIKNLGNQLPEIDLPGPAIGLGMGVKLDLGSKPVCWLSLSARARAGLSSNPLLLAATGTIDGAMHLGPFSIGAHADLQIRVGPGTDYWAKFRVCGSIDLWLTQIEGCVEIEIPPGGPKPLNIPDPSDWPLHKVSLSDRNYVEVAATSSEQATAPVVWPDVVPILQFTLGPSAASVTTPFTFTDAGNAGDGRSGNDQLSYVYKLENLHLYADGGPAGMTEVSGTLEAAWQQPKHALGPGGQGASGGARELALLTYRSDLWAARRTDGGAGHPADPVKAVAASCQDTPEPAVGWALGALATPGGDGWSMGPDPLRAGRYPSMFAADVQVQRVHDSPITEASVLALMPPPIGFAPGRVMLWDLPLDVPTMDLPTAPKRTFGGVLRLPSLTIPYPAQEAVQHGVPEEFGKFAVTITPSEGIGDPALWVTLPGPAVDDIAGVEVSDLLSPWQLSGPGSPLGDGSSAFEFRPPADGRSVTAIRMQWPSPLGLTLLGLRGKASAAVSSAAAAAGAVTRAAATLTAKNQKPPGDRTPLVLKPDTLYKLVVGMRAYGKLGSGDAIPFPAAGPMESVSWFRTAPKILPGLAGGPLGPAGSKLDVPMWRELVDQTAFHTSFLVRYLKGYQPADRALNWYWGDQPTANFDVDHIAQLAGLYGYAVDLACRRTDSPPHPPAGATDTWQLLGAGLVELIDRSVLPVYQQRYVDLARTATCPLPSAGVSLTGTAGLLGPQATYELAVAFPPLGSGTPPVENLPGIVFTTSRYRDPTAQLAELGFNIGLPPGAVTGHLLVDTAAATRFPDGRTVSDSAFTSALDDLGLAPWPLPTTGRSSALWVANGGSYNLVGALLESPEPIHRAGRADVGGLDLDGQPFTVTVADTSGSRLLFLSRAALAPGPTGGLNLNVNDAGVAVTAHCIVAGVPAFAADLS